MIDLSLLREQSELFIATITTTDPQFNTSELIALDKKLRSTRSDVENLRSVKNELAKKGREGLTAELRL